MQMTTLFSQVIDNITSSPPSKTKKDKFVLFLNIVMTHLLSPPDKSTAPKIWKAFKMMLEK
jgi:hypothetical protein